MLWFSSCTERARDNPFDPNSNSETRLTLSVKPEDNQAHLSWSVENIQDFTGFIIYRSVDGSEFQRYQEISPTFTTFIDTALNYYQWYGYRITMINANSETLPSNEVKLLPGPGKIWILSRYGYSLREMSYGLQHTNQIFYTNFPAINWDWNLNESEIWLAFAQFKNISRLNLDLGYEDFFVDNFFQRPIDIKWESQGGRVYILDSNKNSIFILQSQTVSDSISLPSNEFFKILTMSSPGVLAMDSSRIFHYLHTGIIVDSITVPNSFRYTDMTLNDDSLTILATDFSTAVSMIISYQLNGEETRQVEISGNFDKIVRPAQQNYYWVTEKLNSNSSGCVKLSSDGHRLLELNSLSGEIDDIQINPHDNSIIVLQRYQNNIILFDSLGNQLTQGNQVYDPIKAFIY
jgi:hypothetical protein